MMFVDASALVAILTAEPERSVLLGRLDGVETPLISSIAVFETVAAVARKKVMSVADAEAEVEAFIRVAGLRIVPITELESRAALAAHARYGKGRHPARLNVGDCFAYACARVHGVPLLYVGDDFPQTDIRSALG
jgi:ribonuclease VapC